MLLDGGLCSGERRKRIKTTAFNKLKKPERFITHTKKLIKLFFDENCLIYDFLKMYMQYALKKKRSFK